MKTMRKLVKPAHSDPEHSMDLFDADRKNDSGEMFCVQSGILPSEVDKCWEEYESKEIKKYLVFCAMLGSNFRNGR